MAVKLTPDGDFTGAAVLDSVETLLNDNQLCAVSTVTPDGVPCVCTTWFAVGQGIDLVVLTGPATTHGSNLAADDRAAVMVFDSRQRWGTPLRGLQLSGTMRQARGVGALRAFASYTRRFTGITAATKAYQDLENAMDARFFVFQPQRLKLLDEARFGHRTPVTALVE